MVLWWFFFVVGRGSPNCWVVGPCLVSSLRVIVSMEHIPYMRLLSIWHASAVVVVGRSQAWRGRGGSLAPIMDRRSWVVVQRVFCHVRKTSSHSSFFFFF